MLTTDDCLIGTDNGIYLPSEIGTRTIGKVYTFTGIDRRQISIDGLSSVLIENDWVKGYEIEIDNKPDINDSYDFNNQGYYKYSWLTGYLIGNYVFFNKCKNILASKLLQRSGGLRHATRMLLDMGCEIGLSDTSGLIDIELEKFIISEGITISLDCPPDIRQGNRDSVLDYIAGYVDASGYYSNGLLLITVMSLEHGRYLQTLFSLSGVKTGLYKIPRSNYQLRIWLRQGKQGAYGQLLKRLHLTNGLMCDDVNTNKQPQFRTSISVIQHANTDCYYIDKSIYPVVLMGSSMILCS